MQSTSGQSKKRAIKRPKLPASYESNELEVFFSQEKASIYQFVKEMIFQGQQLSSL